MCVIAWGPKVTPPDQLPCGGVSIYIMKGLYHKSVRIDSHLQAVAVQVTLGDAPFIILSVYIPGNNHLTIRDLSHLIKNIRGQVLITGDFNGHNPLRGSLDVDTWGEVIERLTDKHNLCILNDGSHTYLKPQAQYVNKPTSAIDLAISTPGLALRSVWEVLPDTHGSDHYPLLTSILPSVAETLPNCDPSHWVFSRADWEQFHDLCLERITEDILKEADPLQPFVEHLTKAANDSIQGQLPSVRNWTLGLMKNAGKPWRLGEHWTRKCVKVENSEGKPCLLSEGHRCRLADSPTRRNVSHGQSMSQSCQQRSLLSLYGIEWGRYLAKYLPSLTSMRQNSQTTHPPTSVLHSRPLKCRRRRWKLTSRRTTLRSNTNLSDWEISGDQ